jgi:hypothetical protein
VLAEFGVAVLVVALEVRALLSMTIILTPPRRSTSCLTRSCILGMENVPLMK